MNQRWARTAVTAVTVGVLVGSASPAYADDQNTMPLPCTGAEYVFTPIGALVDITKERDTASRYHESSVFAVSVSATPANGIGVTYVGRIAYIHSANDGSAGAGHAVSTMRELATLHGDDGSLLVARTVAHIVATARPDENPEAVIRQFFEKTTCQEMTR